MRKKILFAAIPLALVLLCGGIWLYSASKPEILAQGKWSDYQVRLLNRQDGLLLCLKKGGQILSELELEQRDFPEKLLLHFADYNGDGIASEFVLGEPAGSNMMAYDIFSIQEDALVSCGWILSSEYPREYSPVFAFEDGVIQTELYCTDHGRMEPIQWAWDNEQGVFVQQP